MLKSCKEANFRSITHTYTLAHTRTHAHHVEKEPKKFFQQEVKSQLSEICVLP